MLALTMGMKAKAWFLANVVTRLVKPPAISLTGLAVPPAEVVQVPTRHGPVRCLVTRPAAEGRAASTGRPPVYINLHGGGFMLGAPHQDKPLVDLVAAEVGAVVVNVDYSRAPKVVYPHAHEECFDVLKWVAASGAEMGWDATRIGLGGQSAGGQLTLSLLEMARQGGGPAVAAGVLIVPVVDVSIQPESLVSGKPDPFVNASLMRLIQEAYFPDATSRCDPVASPGLAPALFKVLPPLLIVAAQYDTLRPQTEKFIDEARAQGADIVYKCIPGVDHAWPIEKSTPLAVWTSVAAAMKDHLLAHL